MAPAHSSPASINRLSCPIGMDRQVWKESKGAKGTHEVSIQKGSKGARGTYILGSTGQTDICVRGVERIQGAGHSEASIQKRSKGVRGTYLLESTAQTDKSGCGKNPRERALISW